MVNNYLLLGGDFLFDYHIHSDFSADCSTPMEKTIEHAIEIGLQEICFTEHIDYDYPDPTIRFDLDLVSYEQKIREMQNKYAGQITIRKGIEIGVQPYLLPKYNALLKDNCFDFIICSMHTTEKKDLHSGSFFSGKPVNLAYEMYYNELLECISNFDSFNVIGHIDLVKRYKKQTTVDDFHDIIEEIFQKIIPEGKGIELNTSGFRYGINSGMPSEDILKLYKESGGEIITLGSDSHTESTLAYNFNTSLALLHSIGFKYIATFSGQVPTFHKITQFI